MALLADIVLFFRQFSEVLRRPERSKEPASDLTCSLGRDYRCHELFSQHVQPAEPVGELNRQWQNVVNADPTCRGEVTCWVSRRPASLNQERLISGR